MKTMLIVDDKVVYDSEKKDEAVSPAANTEEDPKGPFHMVMPEPLDGPDALKLLTFMVKYGHLYDRGALQILPVELRNYFVAGPPVRSK